MDIARGFITYIYRGKEFSWDFYPVQTFARPGVSLLGTKERIPGGFRFTLTVAAGEEIEFKDLRVEMTAELDPDDRVFVNGYQSWTESREFEQRERIRGPVWPSGIVLGRYGDYDLYRYTGKRGVFHGWTYSYVRSSGSLVTLAGSLSERQGFTLFEYNCGQGKVTVSRECAGLKARGWYKGLDIWVSTGAEAEVFDAYFKAYYDANPRSRPRDASVLGSGPVPGWTSWYNYYTGITQDIVLANLEEFKRRKVPLQVFQIDDGWQPAIGDWLTPNAKFDRGMPGLAQAAKEAGYQAGLWLAPFVCEEKSALWRDHQDWLLRDGKGRPVKAGFNTNWNGWFYALDFYSQGFRDYLKQAFKTVLDDWGFDMVKLDFLYAAALYPGHRRTRGQVMTEAMEFLREAVGSRRILGCGVPLGPAFGLVDYCRIGSDVALGWENIPLKAVGCRERDSTANSLANTIGRRHLNGRAFLNDPDVFILRGKDVKMTPAQRMTLTRLNQALGGIILTSDNLADYSEEELASYLSAFPAERKTVRSAEVRGGVCTVDYDAERKHFRLQANLTGRQRGGLAAFESRLEQT